MICRVDEKNVGLVGVGHGRTVGAARYVVLGYAVFFCTLTASPEIYPG